MKIKHIQKTTLIDYPGKIACTIFLFGCNFKCPFCHNPELVIREETKDLSEKDVLKFLEGRVKYLEGVCFTGGEPLLTLDFDFLRKIKNMGYLIKLDTNGNLPDKLQEVIEEGLVDFISMDIKSSKEEYSRCAGVNVNIENIERSIKLIMNSKLDYEFRTTILEKWHTTEVVENLVKWLTSLGKVKKYVLQGFKNSGKLINENLGEPNTRDYYLDKLKKKLEHKVCSLEIRV